MNDQSPNALIEAAITQQLPIEHLERLMDLKERWDRQQAKKAFDEAMARFQSKCPIIKKSKKGGATKDGTVAYYYAPIESIVEQTKDLIAECGFSYLIKTNMTENAVEVICEVRHVMGHSEISTMNVPLLTRTGVMSEAQVTAGTTTFAKRYAFCNAFGIMTADDDNDAITPSLMEEFEDITKDWQHKDLYINEVVEKIKSKSIFRKFVISLPYQNQTNEFRELLKKINPELSRKFWIAFQKQNNETATKFINELKSKFKE